MGEDEVLIEVEDLAECGDRVLGPAELVTDRRVEEVRGGVGPPCRDGVLACRERLLEPALAGPGPCQVQRVLGRNGCLRRGAPG